MSQISSILHCRLCCAIAISGSRAWYLRKDSCRCKWAAAYDSFAFGSAHFIYYASCWHVTEYFQWCVPQLKRFECCPCMKFKNQTSSLSSPAAMLSQNPTLLRCPSPPALPQHSCRNPEWRLKMRLMHVSKFPQRKATASIARMDSSGSGMSQASPT